MSANVLLNLSKQVGIRDNGRLFEHLIIFCNYLNKFNKTGACLIDSIHHDIKITLEFHF